VIEEQPEGLVKGTPSAPAERHGGEMVLIPFAEACESRLPVIRHILDTCVKGEETHNERGSGDCGGYQAVAFTEHFLYAVRNCRRALQGLQLINDAGGSSQDVLQRASVLVSELDRTDADAAYLSGAYAKGKTSLRSLKRRWPPLEKNVEEALLLIKETRGHATPMQIEPLTQDDVRYQCGRYTGRVGVFDTAKVTQGSSVPSLGFGTREIPRGVFSDALSHALKEGYRMIDIEQGWGNEIEFRNSMATTKVPREELYITTRLLETQSKEGFKAYLKRLGLSHVDLGCIRPSKTEEDTLRRYDLLMELYREGFVKALGVTSFRVSALESLLRRVAMKPVVYQAKFSVFHQGFYLNTDAEDLCAVCLQNNIHMIAYSVLNPHLTELPLSQDTHVQHIASKLGRTTSQVLIRWALQRGLSVLISSTNILHLGENTQVLSTFSLSELNMRLLDGLAWFVSSGANRALSRSSSDVYQVVAEWNPQA